MVDTNVNQFSRWIYSGLNRIISTKGNQQQIKIATTFYLIFNKLTHTYTQITMQIDKLQKSLDTEFKNQTKLIELVKSSIQTKIENEKNCCVHPKRLKFYESKQTHSH